MHKSSLDKAFETLANRGWLADVALKERGLLKAIASVRCAPAEKRIFEIDGEAQGMIGVVSGSVRLAMKRPSGDEYVLFRPGAGFWVGHYAVLGNAPHLLSCTAAEPTVFVWLPKQPLVRLMEENPGLFNEFSKLTYRHMRNVLDLIARITLKDSGDIEVIDLSDEPRCERSWKRDGTVKQRSDGGMLSDRDAAALGV